jgi:hypothetical protein
MDKHERGFRLQGSGNQVVEGGRLMRFAGIDVGASVTWWRWWVSRVRCCVVPAPLGEDASGYTYLFELLGPPEGCLLALEATGHYWRNLFLALPDVVAKVCHSFMGLLNVGPRDPVPVDCR